MTTNHSVENRAAAAEIWRDVIAYEELPAGTGKTVRIGALELALFRLTSGKVHAVQNRCPHKDGVLAEGIVSGEFVFCPMHDRKIHVPSGEVQKPDDGCVHTYAAKVEDGRVLIAVPAEALLAG
jgi:nitrite reductase (NADH) small subunit